MKAKMGVKGRVVIPAAIRRRLGFEQGMLLELTCEGGAVRIARAEAPGIRMGGLLLRHA